MAAETITSLGVPWLQGVEMIGPFILLRWFGKEFMQERVMTCCVTLCHDLSRDHVSIG
jgi:hypothetical protein